MENEHRRERTNSTNETRQVRRLKVNNGIVLALLVAISGLVAGTRFSLSVLCGGLLVIANFHVLYRTLRGAFVLSASATGASTVVVFKYYIRLIVTGIAIFLLLKFGKINPLGLVLGLSTVVINLVLFGFFEFYKNYIKEA